MPVAFVKHPGCETLKDRLTEGRKMGRPGGMMTRGIVLTLALLATVLPAKAQDRGSVNPAPLPPLANPQDPKTAARDLFGRKTNPAPLAARSIGFYTRGCLAGGIALPVNGQTWQVMRLSRNRNWGHPELVKFLEHFAAKVPKAGWPGLLVGDMAQARGGPMLTGHASHQVGLDADIWLTPMPKRELTRVEREEMSATDMVRAGQARYRSVGLDAGAYRAHPRRRARARDRTHPGQCRDQEGAVPRGRPAIANGCARCGRGGGTIITCICASAARPTAPNASRRTRRRKPKAAARSSITGSETPFSIRRRRRSRRNRRPPLTMADLPPACKQIVFAP